MHEMLRRQCARLGLSMDDAPSGWQVLLDRVSAAYTAGDQERYLLERSITLSTREMRALNASLSAREAEQAALHRVAVAVAAGRPRDEVFDLVAREVAGLLGAPGGRLFRIEADGATASPAGWWDADASEGLRPEPYALFMLGSDTATGLAHSTRQPARVIYSNPDPDTPAAVLVAGGFRVGAAAPIFLHDEVWGVVAVTARALEAVPPGSETTVARFAELAGLAIASAEAYERLERQAMTDPLTGFLNQGEFHRRLEVGVAEARAAGVPISLAIFDLDHFKAVNDVHGHLVGDRVLIDVTRRIRQAVRSEEILGRTGGEEFALLLPGHDAASAAAVAERARAFVAARGVAPVGQVTVSVGIAEHGGIRSAQSLYRDADKALYAAKAAGRNRVLQDDAVPPRPLVGR
jgi:diguanylate cyclase (GGDEF)-like protein